MPDAPAAARSSSATRRPSRISRSSRHGRAGLVGQGADIGALESALARPSNRFLYEGVDDVLDLAATYAVGIASNHPFLDGNKRMAFIALGQFLADNGAVLTAQPDDATQIILGVATGRVTIDDLASWLRTRTLQPPRRA